MLGRKNSSWKCWGVFTHLLGFDPCFWKQTAGYLLQ